MAICGWIAPCRTRVRDRIYIMLYFMCIQLIESFDDDRSARESVIVVVIKIYIDIIILDRVTFTMSSEWTALRFGTVSVCLNDN